MTCDRETIHERRRCSKSRLDLLGVFTLALTAHPLPALFGGVRLPCSHGTADRPSITAETLCCRHQSALLALSPMEQYKMQQQQLAEKRETRLAAENSADAQPTEEALKWKAEAEEFAQQHAATLRVFNENLFRPDEYSERNGLSRSDGYWPFVNRNEKPPSDYTYGEFPLSFFAKLVDRAFELASTGKERRNAVLADLGSGVGRLALWAASTSAWKRVVGIEYLPALARIGSDKLDQMRTNFPHLLLTDDVQLVEGSWNDPLDAFADIDIAFAYTTAISTNGENILEDLSFALRQRLSLGCIVVTTDYKLDPSDFEVIEEIHGPNPGVGGTSTGFIHRKITPGERDVASRVGERTYHLEEDELSSMEASLIRALRQKLQE